MYRFWFAVIVMAVMPAPVSGVWNNCLAHLFNATHITYGEAFWLLWMVLVVGVVLHIPEQKEE
jgi:uncharacterized membrane protein